MDNGEKIKDTPPVVTNKSIETYATDMAEAIESGGGELIKKIIHSEEEAQDEKRNISPESRKNRLFLYVGLGLILLSIALIAILILSRDKIVTMPIEPQYVPIIFNDEKRVIEVSGLSKEEIVKSFRAETERPAGGKEGIEGVYLTLNKELVGLRKFIGLLKGNLKLLDPTVVDDTFLTGFVNNKYKLEPFSNVPLSTYGRDFFMIIKVRSVPDIFADMRNWEGKMFLDLNTLIGVDINATTSYLINKSFEDGIIENKNARVLYDRAGVPVLMYLFADDNSVVVTTTRQAAHEVVLRLARK